MDHGATRATRFPPDVILRKALRVDPPRVTRGGGVFGAKDPAACVPRMLRSAPRSCGVMRC
jgi:hypothetical protein